MKRLRLLISVRYWLAAVLSLPGAFFLSWFLLICVLDRLGFLGQVLWLTADMKWNTSISSWGLVVCSLLDYLFLSSLWIRYKIYYDRDKHQILLKGMAFFIPWKTTVPLHDVVSIVVDWPKTGMIPSGGYRISLVREDKTYETLVGKYRQPDAKRLAQDIASIIDKPMIFKE